MDTDDRHGRPRGPDPRTGIPPGDRRRSDSVGRRREDRGRGAAGRLVLFVAAFLFALGAFMWMRPAPSPGAADSRGLASSPIEMLLPACADPFPAAGPTLANLDWRSRAPAVSPTTFINNTAADRVVDLLAGDQVLLSVALPAHRTSSVDLPIGAYGWRVRHGAAWCASAGQFVREQRTLITDGLQIVATSLLTVRIEPDPQHPSGFELHTSDRPVVASTPAMGAPESARPIAGNGVLVPRAADGHYYLDGLIDGQAVRFVIDTGASGVAIPAELARQLGHYSGPEVVSSTANGRAVGYGIRVRQLTFGPFAAEDVRVAALPSLDRPLLGMSLLQAIEMKQTAEGLELRPGR